MVVVELKFITDPNQDLAIVCMFYTKIYDCMHFTLRVLQNIHIVFLIKKEHDSVENMSKKCRFLYFHDINIAQSTQFSIDTFPLIKSNIFVPIVINSVIFDNLLILISGVWSWDSRHDVFNVKHRRSVFSYITEVWYVFKRNCQNNLNSMRCQ